MKKKSNKKEYGKAQALSKLKEPAVVYKTSKSETLMKQVTINIPNHLYTSFLELFKHIPDVTIVEAGNSSVPEWHKTIVRKRLADAKAHPENLLTWDDMMQELDKE
jgi:hypothetical protein